MNRFKKIIVIMMTLAMTLSLTGCSIDERATEGIEGALRNRAEANRQIAETLYKSGLVDEAFYNSIVENIANNVESIAKKMEESSTSPDEISSLLTAIPWYSELASAEKEDAINKEGDSDNKVEDFFFIDAINSESSTYFNKIPYSKGSKVIPLYILSDDSTANQLRERLSYNIYVISDTVDDLATVSHTLNTCITGTTINSDEASKKTFSACAAQNFVELKDESGNNVTLLDLVGTNDVIKESEANTSEAKNYPGYDLVVSQHGVVSFTVRFREFNQDAINQIIAILGTGEGQYIVDADSNAIYMMEYPTYYIDEFEIEESNTDKIIKPHFAKSDIEVNILNNKMYKVSGGTIKNGLTTGTRTLIENTENYISFSAESKEDSSFVVFGKTKDDYGDELLEYGGKKQQVAIPRIVLRDYLELTYYPNMIENENIVAFGKKIRLTMFDTDATRRITEPIGFYCDIGYKKTSGDSVVELLISDLADSNNLLNGTPAFATYIPSSSSETYINSEDAMPTGTEAIDKMEELEKFAVDKINPTMKFTTANLDSIDTDDYMKTGKQSFYGMTVIKPMVESGLLLWMTSSEEKESLDWWCKWLSENDFKYQLNENLAADTLKDRYQYELGEAGIFVLSYETIEGIQEELDNKADNENTGKFRTAFKVIGWLLVGYSLIMMMCWVVDTNVDLGQQLLTKVTFGRMIAVADASEIGSVDSNSKSDYIDFRGIMIDSIIVMAVGLILINTDIILLLWGVIKAVGNIFSSITQAIKG